jgi:hypothetical protein
MTDPTTNPPNETPRTSAINALVDANDRSAAAMMGLVSQVQRDAELRERKVDLLERSHRDMKRLLLLVAAGLVVILSLGLTNAVNLYNARRNAAITAGIARNAASTNALLYDCLNSQGECGKRNAAEQKRLLAEISRYELVLAHCDRITPANTDPNGDRLTECVDRVFGPNGVTLKGVNE